MTKNQKLMIFENRLKVLESNGKDNFGIQRKIKRQIRNIKKNLD